MGTPHGRSNAYPGVFAAFLPSLREVAREHGYALAVHGSMQRDCDLIAVPWVPDAKAPDELIEAIRSTVGGVIRTYVGGEEWDRNPEPKPHGRLAWSIYLQEGSGPYLDVSVMPRTNDPWPLGMGEPLPATIGQANIFAVGVKDVERQ